MSCASVCRIISARASGNSCAALSMILSNTGWALSTDAAMTLSTSLVAVWCSSASCVSLNSRVFSMAITAWLAKVVNNSTMRAGKSPAWVRVTLISPMAPPWCSKGTPSMLR